MEALHGVLRSADGVVDLGQTTRIGKNADECEIQLDSAGIEDVHAVIERRDDDENQCFVLFDCNSAHGTYVNEARVQNAAVYLAHNDVIKFGHGGKPYRIEMSYKMERREFCPPLNRQPKIPQFSRSLDLQQRTSLTPSSGHVLSRPLSRTTPYTLSRVRPKSALDRSDIDMETRLLKMGDELSRLSAFEAECHRKDKVIEELRDEIAGFRVDEETLRQSQELEKSVDTMKTDLTQQRKTIAALTEEKNALKTQSTDAAKTMTRLRRESAEKSVTVTSLKSEVTQLKTQRQQRRDSLTEQLQTQLQRVKVQLQASERCVQDRARRISVLQGELDAAHQQISANREMNENAEKQLKQLKEKWQVSQAELKQIAEEMEEEKENFLFFCNNLCRLSGLANGRELARSQSGRDVISSHVKQHEEERQRLFEEIQNAKAKIKEVEADEKKEFECFGSIQSVLSKLNFSEDDNFVEEVSREIQEIEMSEKMAWLKEELTKLIQINQITIKKHLQESETLRRSIEEAFDEEMKDQDLVSLVGLLKDDLAQMKQKCSALDQRVREMKEGVSADSVAQLKKELEVERDERIASILAEQEEKRKAAVEREREGFEVRSKELDDEREDLERRIEEMKEAIQLKDEEISKMNESLLQSKENHTRLQLEFQTIQERETLSKNSAQLEKESLEKELRQEVELYREESRQHAVTIVALEEKLLAAIAESKELQAQFVSVRATKENEKLEKGETESDGQSSRIIKEIVSTPPPPLSQNYEVQQLENLVVTLRKHLAVAQQEREEQMYVCDGLRQDLAGMEARLSDLASEMDERQKRTIEELKKKSIDREVLLSQREEQIEQLESISRSQAKSLEENKREIEKQQRLLELRLGEAKEQGKEVEKLVDEIMREKKEKEDTIKKLEKQKEVLVDLRMKHEDFERQGQIVERQRAAIHQLRERINLLEEARPLAPSHEQALRELVLVKRELKDLKTGNRKHRSTSTTEESGTGTVAITEGIQTIPTTPVSLREATNALDRSEKSYLSLVRTLSNCLDLKGMEGSKSVLKMDPESRERVWGGREKAANQLGSQIEELNGRLERKEKLLEGYEEDLKRLREYESESGDNSSKIQGLRRELRDKNAEVQLLRESLKRSHEELDQAQRLHEALLNRKKFQDQQKQQRQESSQRKSGHHCMYTEDELRYKLEVQKQATKETLKRKNFEINSLQRDLHSTNLKLNEASQRFLDSTAKLTASTS